METAIILARLIALFLPLVKTGAEHLLAFIGVIRKAAMQTGEWTPEAEAVYQASLLVWGKEHQPDPPAQAS